MRGSTCRLPKRQLFEEEAAKPSASVSLALSGRKPSPEQVQGVQNLVAAAVGGGLTPESVVVVDQKDGKTLSAAGGGAGALGRMADDRRSEVEQRLAARIKEQLEPVVGPGNARVEVAADIDLARVTQQEETYDPDGQVIVSEQTTEEASEEGRERRQQRRLRRLQHSGRAAEPPGHPAEQEHQQGRHLDHQLQQLQDRPHRGDRARHDQESVGFGGRRRRHRPGGGRQARRLHPPLARGDGQAGGAGEGRCRLQSRAQGRGQGDQRPLRPCRCRRPWGKGRQSADQLRQERHHAGGGAGPGRHRGHAAAVLRAAASAQEPWASPAP